MSDVYLFLADGFEEIEALTVVDLLRRADIDIQMIALSGEHYVKGTHGIEVAADGLFEDTDFSNGQCFVLPGGMPGTNALMAHEGLRELLFVCRDNEKILAAICAGPSVLGMNGLLRGKRATCYPGYEDKLLGAKFSNESVVVDGTVITSRGLGTAVDFALALITELKDAAIAEKIAADILYKK